MLVQVLCVDLLTILGDWDGPPGMAIRWIIDTDLSVLAI